MSQQGLRQASFRAIHGGDGLDYNGDMMAACRAELEAAEIDVPADINGRLLAWLQLRLTSEATNLPGLMAAFARAHGADNWSAVGRFYPHLAPLLADSSLQAFTSNTNPQNYATSGLDVTGHRILAAIGGHGASITLTSLTGNGASADTSASLSDGDTNPRLYLREVTVNDALDALWVATFSTNIRPVIFAGAFSGVVSIPTPAAKAGGTSLPSHDAFALTGGPYPCTVLDICNVRGGHIAHPPVAPLGYDLVDQKTSAATNLPADTARTTMGVAIRVYSANQLEWTDGEAEIPAATWRGLEDVVPNLQLWRAVRTVLVPV
ncbi:MAG: hypothetical protein AB7O44_27460 [Hyphomicrobiaceae bacterium]